MNDKFDESEIYNEDKKLKGWYPNLSKENLYTLVISITSITAIIMSIIALVN